MPIPDYLKKISSFELRNNNNNNDPVSKKFKIGIPKQFFFDVIEPKVMGIFREFVDRLDGCGITTASNVDVDGIDKIFETWRPIRLDEAASIHNEWMVSRSQDYGEDVIRMLEKGQAITAVHYLNALHKWRQEIKYAFFESHV